MQEIEVKIKDIFLKMFSELSDDSFDFKKKQDQYENWDSFAHMELVSKIEQAFVITLDINEMINTDSAIQFVEIVKKKVELIDDKNESKLQISNFNNFSEVLNYWAVQAPDKTFIIDVSAEKSYTYLDFNKLVNSAVRLLKEQNVGFGDIVSIRIRNSSEFLIIYFASIRLGSIINPLPFSVKEEELIKNLDFTGSKLVFLEKINLEKISDKYKFFSVEFEGNDSFINILRKFSNENFKQDEQYLNDNNPACLYYSSGTTSNPKGILYSHKNMVSLIKSICHDFNHTFDTIHLGILPMGHTAITNYSFLPVAYAGGTLVFSENFIKIRGNFWNLIEKYKITYVETVPTIIFSILNGKYPDYSRKKISLQYIGCGSAPLPLSVQKSFQKKFDIPVANLYGLSETGPSHFDNPLKENWQPGSIGVPLGIVECKIVDDNLKELPINEVGEIIIRGSSVFIGYYKNDKAYQEAVKDGFFLTGDLGYKDECGNFFYVDRKKDLIIKGGANILPGEIDEILFKHPAVLEASTIGVPDDFLGEEIVSFVVLKDFVCEKDLIKHCSQFLQYFKCPKRIIFIESIPQTLSGKFLRKKLRTLYDERYKI